MSVTALNQPRFASLALPPYRNVTYAVLVLFALHVLPIIQLTQQKIVSFALNSYHFALLVAQLQLVLLWSVIHAAKIVCQTVQDA